MSAGLIDTLAEKAWTAFWQEAPGWTSEFLRTNILLVTGILVGVVIFTLLLVWIRFGSNIPAIIATNDDRSQTSASS